MKKVLKNIIEAIITVVIWDIIDIISGDKIYLIDNIIGVIVFFFVWSICDYIILKNKK